MPNCKNCGYDITERAKFCPECGQDQSVVVPQDHRVSPEDVLAQEEASKDASAPPPVFNTTGQGEGGASRQEASGPLRSIPRKWQLAGLLGCGGVGLLLLALIVVGIVSSASNNTAQRGSGQESGESKKTSGSKSNRSSGNVTVAVGEPAELDDRTFTVREVERNYNPRDRFSKAESGNEFLRVLVALANTSNRTVNYNPFDFEVEDSNGVRKHQAIVPNVPNELSSGNLAPNGKVEGNLVFEVPRNDNNLKLIYTLNMFSGETVTVEPLQ